MLTAKREYGSRLIQYTGYGERSGTLQVRAGKGNKARDVPLNASARETLAQYVATRLYGAPGAAQLAASRRAP